MLYMLTVTLVERMVSQAVGGLKLRCSEPDIDKTIYNYIVTPAHPISPHFTTPPHHAGHCTMWTYMVVRVGVNISILHHPNVTQLHPARRNFEQRHQQKTTNHPKLSPVCWCYEQRVPNNPKFLHWRKIPTCDVHMCLSFPQRWWPTGNKRWICFRSRFANICGPIPFLCCLHVLGPNMMKHVCNRSESTHAGPQTTGPPNSNLVAGQPCYES